MNKFECCLAGCDQALAEADLLIECLADFPASLEPELAATRQRIAALRHEVERLRGITTLPARRKMHPDWIELSSNGSPWGARKPDQTSATPIDAD